MDKISETGTEWHVDGGDVVEIETRCRIPIWRTFRRIQWHVIPQPRITLQHCRVLPLGEFTVIPEPHATFQGAVIWRNQCHDRATSQGARIPSAILKIVFRHILFYILFLMQFRLWRAAAFVSSLIHLFVLVYKCSQVVTHTLDTVSADRPRGIGRRHRQSSRPGAIITESNLCHYIGVDAQARDERRKATKKHSRQQVKINLCLSQPRVVWLGRPYTKQLSDTWQIWCGHSRYWHTTAAVGSNLTNWTTQSLRHNAVLAFRSRAESENNLRVIIYILHKQVRNEKLYLQ